MIGKSLASVVMILGYSILAVPMGIVTAEIVESAVAPLRITTRCCPHCMAEGHEADADFCKACEESLEPASEQP